MASQRKEKSDVSTKSKHHAALWTLTTVVNFVGWEIKTSGDPGCTRRRENANVSNHKTFQNSLGEETVRAGRKEKWLFVAFHRADQLLHSVLMCWWTVALLRADPLLHTVLVCYFCPCRPFASILTGLLLCSMLMMPISCLKSCYFVALFHAYLLLCFVLNGSLWCLMARIIVKYLHQLTCADRLRVIHSGKEEYLVAYHFNWSRTGLLILS